MTVTVRPMEEGDRERIVALHAEAYRVPEFRLARQRTLPLDQGWVITEAGRVMGGLRVERLAQFFGRRPVPSAMVTAVKIAPEGRGRGLARILMTELVRALHQDGVALSVLYPSSPGLYRSVGYETAGTRMRYHLAAADLPRVHGARVEALEEGDFPPIERCYRAFAARQNGLLDRNLAWWRERILDPFLDRPTYRYGIRDRDGLAGYLVYTHDQGGDLPYSAAIACLDLVWSTETAARTLLAFAGAQGPLSSGFSWFGRVDDPIATVVDSRPLEGTGFPWMLRIVNLDRALAGRGYPPDLEGALSLAVRDGACPGNQAVRRIEFHQGHAAVEPAERATATIDARGLAAIYSSSIPAGDLVPLGLLQGATDGEVALLERAFAGPTPWMVEMA